MKMINMLPSALENLAEREAVVIKQTGGTSCPVETSEDAVPPILKMMVQKWLADQIFIFFCICWSNLSGLGQYQAVYLELVWLGGLKILRVLSACGIHLCPMLEDKNHQTQMMVGRHDRNILCPIKSPKTEINESDWNSCLISIICRMP